MHLKTLYLRNFRNYREAEISFSPSINVIYGDNAQGKTNLLEAISLLSTGRSFRTPHLSELIYSGETHFYLEAEIARDHISHTIKMTCDAQNRRLQLDANSYSHFRPLLGLLPLILHSPADIELISGSPAIRRRLLNLHLAQSDPLYVHHLTRYWRAMKQRNCLLKAKDLASLDCWETEMASSAAYLLQKRHHFAEKLPLVHHSQTLFRETHTLRFHPSAASNYLQQLQKNRPKEQLLGLTLAGPHRDDLSFWIEGKTARIFASEGQKKTATIALRLAEWHHLATQINDTPLLAIDDLALALDPTRQSLLRNALTSLGQVFITTPIPLEGHLIHIANGSRSKEASVTKTG